MQAKKVAILGLGAAGAFAARAAHDCDCEVDVYAYGDTVFPPGANWFNWLPDDLIEKFPPTPIYVVGQGTEEAFRKLMWGSLADHIVYTDFPTKGDYVYGHNPAKVFDALIPMGVDVSMVAGQLSDVDAIDIAKTYDVVLQTFPTKLSKAGAFGYYVKNFVASRKLTPEEDPATHYVICNGTGEGIVVRESNLFGVKSLEFPQGIGQAEISAKVDISDYQIVAVPEIHPQQKPWEPPTGWDPKIHLVGKWAEWNIQRKPHEVYAMVCELLK